MESLLLPRRIVDAKGLKDAETLFGQLVSIDWRREAERSQRGQLS